MVLLVFGLFAPISVTVAVLYAATIIFITIGSPLWLLFIQQYKKYLLCVSRVLIILVQSTVPGMKQKSKFNSLCIKCTIIYVIEVMFYLQSLNTVI